MDEKVNVAELLRYSPRGMELDCTMYDNVSLNQVLDGNAYPIKIETPDGQISLTKYGSFSLNKQAKCIIFPKGKTTWEGFQTPFKDGDVVTNITGAVFIYKEITTYGYCGSFVSLDRYNQLIPHYESYLTDCIRVSTEEEKEKLFKAISAEGYKWDPDTKTLLTVPIFKPGDRIKRKDSPAVHAIKMIDTDLYVFDDLQSIPISVQGDYELVPKKFDVNTLKPFESRMLVRNDKAQCWKVAFWGYKAENGEYSTTYGLTKYCIPYEGNEYLLGKTDDCDDFYKTW